MNKAYNYDRMAALMMTATFVISLIGSIFNSHSWSETWFIFVGMAFAWRVMLVQNYEELTKKMKNESL